MRQAAVIFILALCGCATLRKTAPEPSVYGIEWPGVYIFDNRQSSPDRSATVPKWEFGFRDDGMVIWREVPRDEAHE